MRRPQFNLKTMLWLMAVVAAFLGGMTVQRQLDSPVSRITIGFPQLNAPSTLVETMVMRDGTEWQRTWSANQPDGK